MFNFLKKVFLRGLLVMLPILVLYLTLRELIEIMVGVATPIADLFPPGTFDVEHQTEILAGVLIVGTALVLGLIATIGPLRRSGGWLEDRTLNKLPMYRMLKSFVAAFLDIQDEKSFKPALLDHPDGSSEPVYIIEQAASGDAVVMCPWTPTPFAGSLKIVPMERIRRVQTTLDEYSLTLTHFGLGMAEILDSDKLPARNNPGSDEQPG
jgi:uncharacterized membrane protein